MLMFMKLVDKHQFLYNLVIIINTKSTQESEDTLVNQRNHTIIRFGQTRLRSLEMINQIFSLLHPSSGILAQAQYHLEGEKNPDEDHIEEIQLSKYVNN